MIDCVDCLPGRVSISIQHQTKSSGRGDLLQKTKDQLTKNSYYNSSYEGKATHLVGMSLIVQHVEIEVRSREKKKIVKIVSGCRRRKANLTHCPTSNNGTRQLTR